MHSDAPYIRFFCRLACETLTVSILDCSHYFAYMYKAFCDNCCSLCGLLLCSETRKIKKILNRRNPVFNQFFLFAIADKGEYLGNFIFYHFYC